jgi:signal transduction histidine kinase
VRPAVEAIGYLNLVVFTTLALVAVGQWRQRRSVAALWVAVAFVVLGAVVLAGRAIGADAHGTGERLIVRLELVGLVVFPYLLYRFAQAFGVPSRRLQILTASMTGLLVVCTLLLPRIPQQGEDQPAWFVLYLVAFLAHWTILSVIVSWRLLQAGRGQPTVARRRMTLLAFAAAAITAAIIIAAVDGSRYSVEALVSGAAGSLAGIAFLLGLSPPPLLRMVWRRPEQRRVQDAIFHLMARVASEREVAERVLPPMAEIVGARAIAFLDRAGGILHGHNLSEAQLAQVRAGNVRTSDVLSVDVGQETLVLWPNPYFPFFGDEELRLLSTLTALSGIAFDRARLAAHERQARETLERANELKSNFVALAAHELRTPVSAVNGLIQTLFAAGGRATQAQRDEMERVLVEQGTRLAQLVEQLLDLSRLDADAVAIEPQRLPVRARVEGLVAAVAPDRTGDVKVDVAPGLEAEADPAAFDRIVSNLVVNALRYGRPPVVVRADRGEEHLRVVVEDRGEGVPPDVVPVLFERFTRGRQARAREIGTGLGLAIARSFARAHDGELTYQAAQPTGARFELLLPVRRLSRDIEVHLVRTT